MLVFVSTRQSSFINQNTTQIPHAVVHLEIRLSTSLKRIRDRPQIDLLKSRLRSLLVHPAITPRVCPSRRHVHSAAKANLQQANDRFLPFWLTVSLLSFGLACPTRLLPPPFLGTLIRRRHDLSLTISIYIHRRTDGHGIRRPLKRREREHLSLLPVYP